MTRPEDPDTEIDLALDKILRSVGSLPIKHYMPLSQERARNAMRELLRDHERRLRLWDAMQPVEIPHHGAVKS